MNDRAFYFAISLALFVFGLAAGTIVFIDVQLMNVIYHVGSVTVRTEGYPWWTEQLTGQSCLLGKSPDLNCEFLNYSQTLVISLALSFAGLFSSVYFQGTGPRKLRLHRSAGLALLVFGLLIAAAVFIEVQVGNSVYTISGLNLKFEGFPFGGQEVLGANCVIGSDQYHCVLFNYDELLFGSGLGAFIGLVLFWYSDRILAETHELD
jgi:hypothetical protein